MRNSVKQNLLSGISLEQVNELVWEEILINPDVLSAGYKYLKEFEESPTNAQFLKIHSYPLFIDFLTEDISHQLKIDEKNWNSLDKIVADLKQSRIVYACDIYDIRSYCLPLGLYNKKDEIDEEDEKNEEDIENITDRQLAWQWFFEDNDVVLFDEHKSELRWLKKQTEKKFISKHIDEFQHLLNIISSKGNNLLDLNAINDIQNNLSLYIGLVLGFAKNGLDKLNNIINNKLLINKDQLTKKGFSDEFAEQFSNHHAGKTAIELYQDRKNEIIRRKEERRSSEDNLKSRLFNLATDCQVVDRLLQINKGFSQTIKTKDGNIRYFLIFVSSTEGFERHFANHHLFINNSPKDAFGRKVGLFRNVKQFYLKLLADSNYNPSEQLSKLDVSLNRIETYLSFRKIIRARTSYHTQTSNKEDTRFDKLTKQLRDGYEGLQTLKYYQYFKENIDSNIESFKNTLDKAKLNEIMLELDRIVGDKQSLRTGLDTSNSLLRKLFISYSFQERIEYSIPMLQYGGVIINSGVDDYVASIDQHLPTMLKVRNKDYQIILEKVIQVILNPTFGQEYKTILSDFLRKIVSQSILIEKEASNLFEIINLFDDNIVKYLLFLILPNSDENNETAEKALLWVITSDIRQVKDQITPELDKELKNEFLKTLQNLRYIKVWALRRMGDFEESSRIIALANQTDQEELEGLDPRFYHGAALNHYCLFRRQRDENNLRDLDLLSNAIEYAEIARDKFLQSDHISLTSYPNTNAGIKAYIALVNSLVNLKVLLFRYKSDGKYLFENEYLIVEARSLFESEVKKNLGIIFSDVKRYPEYQHTEAYLEYFEAKILYYKSDYATAKSKVEFAYNALSNYNELATIRDAGNPNKMKQSKTLYNDLKKWLGDLNLLLIKFT